jgi:hypothetical protein
MCKEVEIGVAGDLRMQSKELRKLRIVAGYIVLIGEQGGIASHYRGEGRAEAEKLDELLLGLGELFVGDGGARGQRRECGGAGRCGRSSRGGRCLRGGDRGAEAGGECDGAESLGKTKTAEHGAFPHCVEGVDSLLHTQRVRGRVG